MGAENFYLKSLNIKKKKKKHTEQLHSRCFVGGFVT